MIDKKTGWAIGATVAVGLLALGALQYRAIPAPETRDATGPILQDAAWLNLRAERVGAEWHLLWNREAVIVRSASNGHLQIVDGDYHKDLALDTNDLRNGSLVYAPMTDEVSFRLEVFDATHQRMLGESVRAAAGIMPAGSAPRPKSSNESTAATDTLFTAIRELMRAQNPARDSALRTPDASDSDRTRDRENSFGARPAMKPPVHAFTPPAVGGEVIVAKQRAQGLTLPAPPSVMEQGAPAAQPAFTALPLNTPTPPPEPNAAITVADSTPPTESTATEQAAPAVIIRKVAPVYPRPARLARVSGVVEVSATVDVDGRTKNVRAESGPPLLCAAAVEAVRQFVYNPAMVNGRPVESTARVQINFHLDH